MKLAEPDNYSKGITSKIKNMFSRIHYIIYIIYYIIEIAHWPDDNPRPYSVFTGYNICFVRV